MSKRDFTYEQLATVPLEVLEQAFRSRKRITVLERAKDRCRERIANAEKMIKAADREIAELMAAKVQMEKAGR